MLDQGGSTSLHWPPGATLDGGYEMTETLARPATSPVPGPDFQVASLNDRYLREDGTIYLTGIHALVRVLLDRARHDSRRQRNTATYVSGYEGSPLGGYDLELA